MSGPPAARPNIRPSIRLDENKVEHQELRNVCES